MNMAMEMHDSFILELHQSDDGLGFILFDGVVYQFEGEFGEHGHVSGWQHVRMNFTQMTFEGEPFESRSYVADGHLAIDGVEDNGLISFPIDRVGSICLSMCVSDDFTTRTVRAASVGIACEGEFELEAIWDSQGNRTAVDRKA